MDRDKILVTSVVLLAEKHDQFLTVASRDHPLEVLSQAPTGGGEVCTSVSKIKRATGKKIAVEDTKLYNTAAMG
ncbi:hypothetical protein E2C01_008791 [Portunus trituberculatus]|uniref:Uncharacterized protein n=1 Tax=Portunus trituberculatus TaxID=210409 RepID=A0A5B7D535_PORTR|nr:hypothetical protein [Portunus trituberculatus]